MHKQKDGLKLPTHTFSVFYLKNINRSCLFEYLTTKIRKENPDIDDERAEIINYGLQVCDFCNHKCLY